MFPTWARGEGKWRRRVNFTGTGFKPAMLSLGAVSAGYGSFRALSDVSLAVDAGETVGVIGPNGAGKTTLLRVISGLVPPLAGELTFAGRSIGGTPAPSL